MKRNTIVRGSHILNLGRTGRPNYAKTRGLIQYIAHGHYQFDKVQDQQRGEWQDHNGQQRPHESVIQWARERVHHHRHAHTYQLLLSTRYGHLEPQDFNDVLAAGSEISHVNEWRFMLHDDTDNQHAHVILFRREALTQQQYKAWQQTMQQALDQMQQMRQEQAQQLVQQQQQDGGQSL